MMEPNDRRAAAAPRLAHAQDQAFSYRKVNKSNRDAHHQVYIDAVLLGHVWQEPTRVIGADGIPTKSLSHAGTQWRRSDVGSKGAPWAARAPHKALHCGAKLLPHSPPLERSGRGSRALPVLCSQTRSSPLVIA